MQGRAIRRHHEERMKDRMRRYISQWSAYGRERLLIDLNFIGRMAQCHGTHDCQMCHFEKDWEKPEDRKMRWVYRRLAQFGRASDSDSEG